jgi:hypothetical protein
MDKCFAWLKLQWVGSYLNNIFMFIPSGMSLLVSKVQGKTFHNMKKENNKWNQLFSMEQNNGNLEE